ncbi:hypothetical protein BOTBODRAFT_38712 [Botryobasidium botryosum FD-172 SS1]|uniref:Uncharacterized protein n=1 Tax=Botryobasidium botryosum (strain FD-172 SS1) TaxID=930990 RepID=A0A067M6L5_BOTB1|nr:hypothetical protein BOTBODRAFT_38712 [Botryobasidium botryosum FD-172 SS1]
MPLFLITYCILPSGTPGDCGAACPTRWWNCTELHSQKERQKLEEFFRRHANKLSTVSCCQRALVRLELPESELA